MVWYGMVYGMVWYGMVWYGMVWYDIWYNKWLIKHIIIIGKQIQYCFKIPRHINLTLEEQKWYVLLHTISNDVSSL